MAQTRYNSITNNNGNYAASDVVVTGPARLRGMIGYNNGPSQFIMIFDSNTVPADGTYPVFFMPVGASEGFSLTFPEMTDFDYGIAWCCSTTLLTKTVGTASIAVTINYGGKINQ